MDDPYRQSTFLPSCVECGRPASGTCPRCGAPRCDQELGRLCRTCEEAFSALLEEQRARYIEQECKRIEHEARRARFSQAVRSGVSGVRRILIAIAVGLVLVLAVLWCRYKFWEGEPIVIFLVLTALLSRPAIDFSRRSQARKSVREKDEAKKEFSPIAPSKISPLPLDKAKELRERFIAEGAKQRG